MVTLDVQAFAIGNFLGLVAWILSYIGAKYHLARQLIRAQQRAKESKAPQVRAEKVLPTQEEEAGNKGNDTAAAAQAASILAASREESTKVQRRVTRLARFSILFTLFPFMPIYLGMLCHAAEDLILILHMPDRG